MLEAVRGGAPAAVIAWHVKALAIRFRLGIPEAINNLAGLAAQRDELGPEAFTNVLTRVTSDARLAEAIASILDQLDEPGDTGP